VKIEIRNGRLLDPRNGVDRVTTLYIAAGKVAAIDSPPNGWSANRVINAQELVVCPGLIDIAARLREPGFEYKATMESEMAAAMAGGVTSLACPPDTDPPLDEPGLVEMLKYRAHSQNRAHVYPVGALSVRLAGEDLTEMGELAEAGCVAFSHADRPLVDTQVLHRAMQYAATFDYSVWLRPQDAHIGRGGVAHDGEVATRLGLPPVPAVAETIALATILTLARDTGARIHICRISTAEGVRQIRAAKKEGLAVTCDVGIHHLHLCDIDIGWFNAQCRLVPPLRSTTDRAALRAGVADGAIDVVCSDHTPVDDDGKQLPFGEAEPGATGLELLLPLMLKWAAEDNIPLGKALQRVTHEAAAVLRLNAGHLAIGQTADVCIFDPAAYWRVDAAALKSQGKNTPYLGLEVPGKVRATLVAGQVMYES
jgi:dihydroorotase